MTGHDDSSQCWAENLILTEYRIYSGSENAPNTEDRIYLGLENGPNTNTEYHYSNSWIVRIFRTNTVAAHLSECLSIHGSSGPVQIQHLGPLLISWFWLGQACTFSSHKRSLALSLGCQSPPSLVAASSLQSLTQDTSPKHSEIVRFCGWCSDCFMSVWKLQKLEMLWTCLGHWRMND